MARADFSLERLSEKPQRCRRDRRGLHGSPPTNGAEKTALIQPETLNPLGEGSPTPDALVDFGEIPKGPQHSDFKGSQEQREFHAVVEAPQGPED